MSGLTRIEIEGVPFYAASEVEALIAELEAVVEKLPHDKNGVTLTPGTTVRHATRHELGFGIVEMRAEFVKFPIHVRHWGMNLRGDEVIAVGVSSTTTPNSGDEDENHHRPY